MKKEGIYGDKSTAKDRLSKKVKVTGIFGRRAGAALKHKMGKEEHPAYKKYASESMKHECTSNCRRNGCPDRD